MSSIDRSISENDYQLNERESCYKGFFSLEKYHYQHRRFDGSMSREIVREIFVRGDATCVLPYDPVRGKVVLLEQFRAGALLSGQNPWLIELVAGINDKDELPEDIARREAAEEAGLELLALEPIVQYLPSPGGSTEFVYLYCALVNSEGAGGIFGLAEEDEDIKVHVVDVEMLPEMLANGEVSNSPAIIAIQWLLLNKARLDELWGQTLVDGSE